MDDLLACSLMFSLVCVLLMTGFVNSWNVQTWSLAEPKSLEGLHISNIWGTLSSVLLLAGNHLGLFASMNHSLWSGLSSLYRSFSISCYITCLMYCNIVNFLVQECVPVLLSDHAELPFQNVIDYGQVSIKWPSSRIGTELLDYLASISGNRQKSLQNRFNFDKINEYIFSDSRVLRHFCFPGLLLQIET